MSDLYVCVLSMQDYRGVWGDAPPGKGLEIGYSDTASEAIFREKSRAL